MSLNFWNNKKIRFSIIGVLVLLCAVLAFVIRILPQADLVGTGDVIAGPDAWYNLRLVEVLLQNGEYIDFEAMTLYPIGQEIVWGPLFTYISAFFAIAAGAASRIAIIDAVSWVPAIMGALMVPVTFFLGKKLGDWKTGLIGALFIAVIGGQFFSRSLYGHIDHHIAETLFSSLFCLCYILALAQTRDRKIEWKKFSTLKIPLIFGILSGIAYLLSVLTMTTIIVFGLFVAFFTLIQFVIDYRTGHPTEYLVALNTLTFGTAAIGQAIYGIRAGFSPVNYSLGLFLAQILVIIGTLVLYFLIKVIEKIRETRNIQKPWLLYLLGIIVINVIAVIVSAFALPNLYNMVVGSISRWLMPASGGSTTIQEAAGWSWDYAVSSFNWALLLAVCGAIVLIVKIVKEQNPCDNFVFWWSLGTFILVCAQIRWEYYFAANIALLSAVFVGWAITFSIPEIKKLIALIKSRSAAKNAVAEPTKKGKNAKRLRQESAKNKPNIPKFIFLVLTITVAVAFAGISLPNAVSTSSVYGRGGGTAAYWIDACEWLDENTPDTGVDYYTLYKQDTFEYPEEAYGIVSWWDFGHYITVIGNRLPVANPFQGGVTGKYGVASILMETDESKLVERFDYLDSKYVMVDHNSGNNFIGTYATWLGKTPSSLTKMEYYGSFAYRLYNLLGSRAASDVIPALQHFRFIYDSPEYMGTYDNSGQIVGATARIFEYVKGAVIKGEGTISTTLTTNTGGTVTYEQSSVNGQFIVPYATGKNGAITASVYTIEETGETVTVSEEQIQNGLVVN